MPDTGGGGSAPASQTQVTDLPEWAKPYAEKTLAKTEALTTDKPYQSYGQWATQQGYNPSQVAGFTGLQQKAFEGAQGMQTSPEAAMAAGIASAAALQGLGTGYSPMYARNQYRSIAGYQPSTFTNQFAAPGAYQAGQFGDTYTAPEAYQSADFQNRFAAPGTYQAGAFESGYEAPTDYQAGRFQNQFQGPGAYQAGQFAAGEVSGPQLEQYQMGPAERVRADTFGGRQAAQYMSPYIEQAMEPQLREAARASDIQRNINQAQAVQQGAFGGSRQAIVEAERQRNLATQQGDIRAKGLQSAYEQAQAQFNQDAARRLQAQQLNQQAGLTVGQQNLAAQLGVQQLGAQTGLQAALANQQAAMQAQQLAEQSRQFGAGQGLSAAQLQAQYGLSAQQAEEASRQFAATQAAQAASQKAQYGLQAQQLAEQSRQFGAGQGLSAAQLQAQYGLSADQAAEASRQFGANQAAQIAAQQAQAKQAAQQAYEQSRQFGAGQGMTAAQLQAQYGLSAQQAQEAANQFGYGQAAQQAQQRAQYGQAAQQLMEQSRQYGAGLGLQGLQTALQGAGQLGNLGGQQFQQAMDINKLQQAYGTQQQQLNQAQINQRIQDYQAQQKYPYQQLEFMSNILRGTPMGTVQSLYSNPSPASQLLGAGTSLAGAYMMGGGRFAKGGKVKEPKPAGLADLALSKI